MQKNSLQVSKTARFFQLGQINEDTEEIWIVCHGYRQLANYFLRKFKSIASPHRVIIAPEGLHRFYVEGYSGRVGATWMTKEDREEDIKDYLRYLDQLSNAVISDHIKLNVLGFSQGAATISRWAAHTSTKINNLILWSGVFPPDMDIKPLFREIPKYIVVGNEDPFITEEGRQKQLKFIESQELKCEVIYFKGGHDIDQPTLVKLVKSLI